MSYAANLCDSVRKTFHWGLKSKGLYLVWKRWCPMWQRFTQRARRVILSAQEEAQRMHSDSVGTEHLLLGLAREEEGIAAKVLNECEIWFPLVRVAVEKAVPPRPEKGPSEVKLTPKSKRVLELAADESRRFRHSYIGVEHLLLALLREKDGIAAKILADFGLDLEIVRSRIIGQLASNSPGTSSKAIYLHQKTPFPEITPDAAETLHKLFTPTAVKLIRKAAAEAAKTKQAQIDIEHILLGLLSHDIVVAMRSKADE